MVAISINEIQQDLLGYLRRIQAGELLFITDQGRAIAELKPVIQKPCGRRPIGLCAGEFQVPDNFDDPLPDDVLRGFSM